MRDCYRFKFPRQDTLKNKDIEMMIKEEFNNKGVYLKEQHNYYIDKERKKIRTVFVGYTLKQ